MFWLLGGCSEHLGKFRNYYHYFMFSHKFLQLFERVSVHKNMLIRNTDMSPGQNLVTGQPELHWGRLQSREPENKKIL